MQFVDKARIVVKAGNGGDGHASFHREKYVQQGGPDGGDGGRGGDLVFFADPQMSTLLDFKYQRFYRAENGEPGKAELSTGKNGKPLVIRVPVGTIVRDVESGAILADMSEAGKERVIYRRSQFPVKRRDSELWEKLPLDKGWLSYTYEIALVGRNDFFSHGDGSGENIWDSIYIFKDILNEEDEKWPFRSRPALTRKELSAPLNVPEVTMLFPPGRNVTVTLNSRGNKSFTPDFGHFEIFRKGRWRHVPRQFTISKKEWFRGIRLRTVSLCGVSGPSLFLKKGK